MNRLAHSISRREFLRTAALGAALAPALRGAQAPRGVGRRRPKAQIALSLNLEMSRHFPTWGQTHWDYEKGNLDGANKRFAVEAGRFVKERGSRITYMVVGQVLEHESIAWLEEIHGEGHPLGNHTYNHVNLFGSAPEDLQFRFRRAPWLVEGMTPEQIVERDIRMTNQALRERLGIQQVRGFRSSEDYLEGLRDKPEIQQMLKRLGFDWVGTVKTALRFAPLERPTEEVFRSIGAAQADLQPFLYPSGLVELPKCAMMDAAAFRTGRWGLADYMEGVRRGAQWAIDNGGFFQYVAHSSILVEMDPEFRTFGMLCDMAKEAGDRAELVTLDQVADSLRAGRRS